MRKYAVEVRDHRYAEFSVEAGSIDDAKLIAEARFWDDIRDDMDSDGPEFDVFDLGEVETDG